MGPSNREGPGAASNLKVLIVTTKQLFLQNDNVNMTMVMMIWLMMINKMYDGEAEEEQ